MIVFKHFINSISLLLSLHSIFYILFFIFSLLYIQTILIIYIKKTILNMQIRAFKLPPLPGKKNAPLQVVKRSNRLLQQQIKQQRTPSHQRSNKLMQKQSSQQNLRNNINKRPSSVREVSRQSLKSRGSRQSRDSSRQKSIQILKDKVSHNVKARVSMPSVTAKSWGVYQLKQAKMIYGKRLFKCKQIASLTKIMNLITIIELIDELKLAPIKIRFRVSREASYLIGTTASLKQNYELSLYDLYFGMMLPSGNDAAHQIAQIGGCLLLMQKNQGQIKKQIVYSTDALTQFYLKQQSAVNVYLAQMNRLSKRLQMTNSHFANPHGLSNPDNYSCVEDLCRLCTHCMQNQIFRYVVRSWQYNAQIIRLVSVQKSSEGLSEDDLQTQVTHKIKETIKWQNTNKMLKQGWSGIKTGITPNAGPCLAASVEKFLNGRNLQFLVILIDSASMEARWKQVRQIVQWVIQEKIYF